MVILLVSDISPYCPDVCTDPMYERCITLLPSLLTFHSNSMASRVRHHYGVKGRVVRLHQDSVSEFNEGDEAKDSLNDFGDVSAFVVSDAFARVPRGTVGFDHNLGRF